LLGLTKLSAGALDSVSNICGNVVVNYMTTIIY